MSDTPRYDARIDLGNRNDSHTLVIEQVLAHTVGRPGGARVLDVGCATGTLGAALRERGLHVTGIEPDPAAARIAASRVDELVLGTLETLHATRPDARFDAIVFADVLEHLVEPAAALRLACEHLADGGVIVASVPNVTHASVRALLLEGRWETGPLGILDRTHLRFFGRRALVDLFTESGCAVQHLGATTQRVRDANRAFDLRLGARAMAWAELLAADDGVEVFQHVVTARPARDAAERAALSSHNAPWGDGSRPLALAAPTRPRWRRRLAAAAALLRARAGGRR